MTIKKAEIVEEVVGDFCMDCGRDTPEACELCPIRELMDSINKQIRG